MRNKIANYLSDIQSFTINDIENLDSFRLQYLSKKGIINSLFDEFKTIPNEEKREIGKILNELKVSCENKFSEYSQKLSSSETSKETNDLSLPSIELKLGSRHPISLVKNEICAI
jgi:phenylalanyl-tRNA synthetase alpha chain